MEILKKAVSVKQQVRKPDKSGFKRLKEKKLNRKLLDFAVAMKRSSEVIKRGSEVVDSGQREWKSNEFFVCGRKEK